MKRLRQVRRQRLHDRCSHALCPLRQYFGSSGSGEITPETSAKLDLDIAVSIKHDPKTDTNDRPLLAENRHLVRV